MKATSIVLTLLFMLVLGVTELMAQAPPPSTNPPGAPLDVMVGVLLVAGVGYGAKRMKKGQ